MAKVLSFTAEGNGINRDPATETVGYMSQESAAEHLGADWKIYKKASDAFARAKEDSTKAKEQVRARFKAGLKLEGIIDFTIQPDGRVLIVKILRQKKKKTTLDDSFTF